MNLNRMAESYNFHTSLWDARVAARKQPDQPYTSPHFLVAANVFYLGFTFLLYRFMVWRGRPFQCGAFKSILAVYNLSCVVLAAYVVWGILVVMRERPFSFVCNKTLLPGEDEGTGHAEFLAHVFWVFYAQKFWEFFDTWFFVLRMSFRQVTFLHIFHHCSINIVVGLILPFEFSGDMYLPILLNAIVHTLMYSHYLATILKVKAPWRPALTSMQLLQFCLIATQSAMALHAGDGCGGPYFGKIGMVLYMASMLVLFGNFFVRAYLIKKPHGSTFGDGVVMRPQATEVSRTYTGRAVLDSRGCANVELPAAKGVGEYHYQVTPIGRPMPELHVHREPTLQARSFELAGGHGNATVSWCVTEKVMLFDEKPKAKPLLSCCDGGNSQDAQGSCCEPGAAREKKAQ